MTDLLYILFLSWVVIYADFHMTKGNLGAIWNGVGAIPSVLDGSAQSPMQYRVLVPWICGFLSRWLGHGNHKFAYLHIYLRVKWVAIVAALWCAHWYFGQICLSPDLATAILAAYFVWAAIYDYADVYVEIALLSAAFASLGTEYALLAAAVIAFVAALNRETAVLIPMVLILSGAVQDAVIVSVFFAAGVILPAQVYGKKKRYCSWFMWRENLMTIRATFARGKPFLLNEYGLFFALAASVIFAYGHTAFAVGLSPVEVATGILFVGMLIPSMWREIRVFAPVMLAVIPMVIRGVAG